MKYICLFLILTVSSYANSFTQKMKPFLEKHCVSCHGEKKQKGKLRLDNLSTDFGDLEIAEQWQFVLDELNGATMPPEDEPQPSQKELTEILELLTYKIEDTKKIHHGKQREVVMRRLNKREYINTIYELIGVRLDESEVIEDQSTAEYDNHGEGLYVSSFLLAKYREYAYKALNRALANKSPKSVVFEKKNLAQEKNESARKEAAEIKKNKFKYTKKVARRKQEDLKSKHAHLVSYLAQPDINKGILIDHGSTVKFTAKNDKANLFPGVADYKMTFNIEVKNLAKGDKPFLLVGERHIDLSTALNKRQEFKFEAHHGISKYVEFGFYVDRQRQRKQRGLKRGHYRTIDVKAPKMIVSSFKVEYKDKSIDDLAFKKIFPVNKRTGESDEEYIVKVLKIFALKAYRGNEISDSFLSLLLDLYKSNVSRGMNRQEAVKEPLAIILSSPKFVYLKEQSVGNTKFISDMELAVRLSYFLWSSPPDQELYKLAVRGQLSQEKTLKGQVVRMLKDERSQALGEGFFNNWLEVKNLNIIDVKSKDSEGPHNFNPQVERLLRKEPLEFFRTLALKNLSIVNMIDSEFLTINQTLASYYGLPVQTSENEFNMVKLPKDSPRGGLLGMGAVLSMLGNGDRGSPVLRGNFVLTRMMGMSSPPPPPNVPDLEVQVKGNIREKLLAHQAKPQCASCHKRIDPAGFGLEVFDQAGQWLGVNRDNKSIIHGKLPALGQYKNFFEQRQLLLKNKDNFAKGFIENLASYAFAREVGFSDSKLVDRLLADSKRNGYKLGSLISEVVLSDEFRLK